MHITSPELHLTIDSREFVKNSELSSIASHISHQWRQNGHSDLAKIAPEKKFCFT